MQSGLLIQYVQVICLTLTEIKTYRYIPKMENRSAYSRNGSGEYQRNVKYQLEK
jgi:hypothetical protein